MTAVLVTGAGGFLGSAMVNDLLVAGYRVRALVRRPAPGAFPEAVELIEGDVRDPQCARRASIGCDAIVHLAGLAHAIDDERVGDDDYDSVNVGGTKHMLESAVQGGVRRFILTSSVKVFGETTMGCANEMAPPAPQTPYAWSKWKAEQLVASYAKEGSLAALSLRLPLVYGPTTNGNLYRMIAAIEKGLFPPLPRIGAVRSMLHFKNFVLAVRAVLESSRFGQSMYVVTDEKPYSITEVYDLLRAGLGIRPPRWRVPLGMLSLGGRCGDVLQALLGRPMPLSSSALQKLLGQAWYSSEALIRDTRYRPRYAFATAVPELIDHYRRSRP